MRRRWMQKEPTLLPHQSGKAPSQTAFQVLSRELRENSKKSFDLSVVAVILAGFGSYFDCKQGLW